MLWNPPQVWDSTSFYIQVELLKKASKSIESRFFFNFATNFVTMDTWFIFCAFPDFPGGGGKEGVGCVVYSRECFVLVVYSREFFFFVVYSTECFLLWCIVQSVWDFSSSFAHGRERCICMSISLSIYRVYYACLSICQDILHTPSIYL